MKHTFLKTLAVAAVAGLMVAAPHAQAVFIPSPVLGGQSGGSAGNDNLAALIDLTGKDCLEFIYRDNANGAEEGSQPGYFQTTFSPTESNATTATLDYTGPSTSLYDWACAFIVVKGGSSFVYYSLAGWNGIEDIQVTNSDLPNAGQSGRPPAISHVSVYACPGTTTVPEGGLSVALLGLGLAGLGLTRRFLGKKA